MVDDRVRVLLGKTEEAWSWVVVVAHPTGLAWSMIRVGVMVDPVESVILAFRLAV